MSRVLTVSPEPQSYHDVWLTGSSTGLCKAASFYSMLASTLGLQSSLLVVLPCKKHHAMLCKKHIATVVLACCLVVGFVFAQTIAGPCHSQEDA